MEETRRSSGKSNNNDEDNNEKMSDGTPNMALLTGMPVPLTAPGLRGGDAASSSSSAVEPAAEAAVTADSSAPLTAAGEAAKKPVNEKASPALAPASTLLVDQKPKKEKAGRFAPPTEEELAMAKAKALERTNMAPVKASVLGVVVRVVLFLRGVQKLPF